MLSSIKRDLERAYLSRVTLRVLHGSGQRFTLDTVRQLADEGLCRVCCAASLVVGNQAQVSMRLNGAGLVDNQRGDARLIGINEILDEFA